MSFAHDLISTLGLPEGDARVKEVVERYALHDTYEDPPFRCYVGSSQQGVDLLFERGVVLDVQFFIQRSESHLPFRAEPPFGIAAEMTDADIHNLLGAADVKDIVGSRYLLLDGTIKLTVVYDKSDIVAYLSVTRN